MSTLTVVGLTAGVPYYLRVGGLNWYGVANWVYVGGSGGDMAWVSDAGKAWPINNLKTSPTLGTAVTTGMIDPRGIAITPDGSTAWVADYSGGEVWPITNLKTTPTLGTAVSGMTSPYAIAITPDGNTVWVADSAGKAWPINNVKTTPMLGTPVTGMSAPEEGIAITPDGNTAWLTDLSAGKALAD